MSFSTRIQFNRRARNIAQTLGVRAAAGFLRNRDFTLEEALVSLGMPVRRFA